MKYSKSLIHLLILVITTACAEKESFAANLRPIQIRVQPRALLIHKDPAGVLGIWNPSRMPASSIKNSQPLPLLKNILASSDDSDDNIDNKENSEASDIINRLKTGSAKIKKANNSDEISSELNTFFEGKNKQKETIIPSRKELLLRRLLSIGPVGEEDTELAMAIAKKVVRDWKDLGGRETSDADDNDKNYRGPTKYTVMKGSRYCLIEENFYNDPDGRPSRSLKMTLGLRPGVRSFTFVEGMSMSARDAKRFHKYLRWWAQQLGLPR